MYLDINTTTTESDSVENPNTRNKIPFKGIETICDRDNSLITICGQQRQKASFRRYAKHFRFDAQSEALYYSEKPLKQDNVVNINNLRKVLKSEKKVTRALEDVDDFDFVAIHFHPLGRLRVIV